MAKKPKTPKKPERYGEESSTVAEPPPVRPGSCKTCGAYPPCSPHKR